MSRVEKLKSTVDFEIRGFFSINDELEILGKILHTIDGIFLELPISNEELEIELDHLIGINNQDVISLFNLRRCGYSESDISITKYRVEYMICDSKPYSKLEDINLSKVYFSFEYLNSFMQKQKGQEKAFYIHYLEADLKEWVSENSKSSQSSRDGFESSKQVKPNYLIEYKVAKPILDIKSDIVKLQNFLSILTGVYMPISFFRFDSSTLDLAGNQMRHMGRFYFYQAKERRNVPKVITSYNYQDLVNNFSSILNSYFANYSVYEAVIINLMANLKYNNLVETQYFDAISSVEEVTRLNLDGRRNLSNEVLNFRNQVLDLLDQMITNSNDRKLVENALESIDYKSFVCKLKELCKALPKNLRNKIILKDNPVLKDKNSISRFASKCVATRNYHAHGSIDRKDDTFNPEERFYASKILNLITEYYLMKAIGISDEIISAAILQKRNYWSVVKSYSYQSPNVI